jgi:hypothetical protein
MLSYIIGTSADLKNFSGASGNFSILKDRKGVGSRSRDFSSATTNQGQNSSPTQLPARAGKDLYYKAAGPWGRDLGIFKGFVRQNASFH